MEPFDFINFLIPVSCVNKDSAWRGQSVLVKASNFYAIDILFLFAHMLHQSSPLSIFHFVPPLPNKPNIDDIFSSFPNIPLQGIWSSIIRIIDFSVLFFYPIFIWQWFIDKSKVFFVKKERKKTEESSILCW